jgi:drug/metabolite transporter (DMT)-like permease
MASFLSIVGNSMLSFSNLFAKFLYVNHPDMNEYQFFSIRSISHLICISLIMNVSIKKQAIDQIKKEYIGLIVGRTIVGVLISYIMVTALRYLPLVIVSLIISVAPLFTVLIAFILLKERIS